ncbi:hypothetical protein PAXINDRAFT_137648 [Paxillus involutus ATCC 200175]|uniref:DUF6699 domain-containing protein n=1 Tax=Paxillus involutus ATCC 200175 TaxID=664439 RepID=A0A0C9TWU3_PAXIN|nr:hypothetical protein PAXINDRAFT_137648 [Paxillus involutus ATCC 200175]
MSRLFRARTNLSHNSCHNATGHPATGQFIPLYGQFQARTQERHGRENGHPRVPPVGQTSGLGPNGSFNETHFRASVLTPHPILAARSLQLIYDLRLLPAAISFPPTSPYSHGVHQQLSVPMHAGNPRRVRLISPDFPWSFDLDFSSHGSVNAGISGWGNPEPRTITCLDLLTSLHVALQQPLTDVEWGTGDDKRRQSILRARDRRLQSAQHTAAARNHSVLRVDWLGPKVLFGGLVRDDGFARSRLFPGTTEGPPETWVVRFRKL